MKINLQIYKECDGFVLVYAMMILLVLSLLGIAALNTTTTELMIAGNDYLHKKTFYRADGGTEIASSVIEENIACVTGFAANSGSDAELDGMILVGSGSLNLWQKTTFSTLSTCETAVDPDERCQETREGDFIALPADTYRDILFPSDATNTDPRTNITVFGSAQMTTGSALQMAAGYEGKGKGIGSGGSQLLYDVYAQRLDVNNAEALIHVQWRHTIGQEGECYYD
ncbi:MAG: pilus assembly PilX N-terminal domain-containing protein [Spirochaetales bacterium]|nr:pilus assembly PilX N-terminal domain-containing protein [Spirochaetales bacterium]